MGFHIHLDTHVCREDFYLDLTQVMLLFLHNPLYSHLAETCDRFEVISGSFKIPPPPAQRRVCAVKK